MAPVALADLGPEPVPPITDPSVFPPEDADERLKKLWNLHGHPHSKRFANPELTSLAALVKHNAATQPSQPAFLHPQGESFAIIDWETFDRLVTAAATQYAATFQTDINAANEHSRQPTVALLGTGNTIDYLVTQIALVKLHIRVLLLSNKNAPAAREHLLQACDAVGIIADQTNAATLSAENCPRPRHPLLTLQDLEAALEILASEPPKGFSTDDEWNLQAMIIHSSGSTGLPKPIIHTNRSLCLIARMYRLFPDFVIENWYLCFPLFHIAGVSVALSGLPTGLPTTLPPTAWPPSPSSILAAFAALAALGLPADCLHCAPSVIADLHARIAATTADFAPLTALKVLQPGGAPLAPSLLAALNELGANVKTTYGSTEIGPPFRTVPHTRDNPWCYRVRNLYPESPFVRMEAVGEKEEKENGDGDGDGGAPRLFECVVYKGFELAAELWLAPDAPDAYRTGDLFVEVGGRGSGCYELLGRADDVLVHDNGEKTHAAALQTALEESGGGRVVAKAAVFGSGRPCVAAVVEVAAGARERGGGGGDGDDELEKTVWDAVRRCNESAARHSRIDRALLLVLGPGESLPVTPKGNVRRKEAWKLFGDRVDDMYERHLQGASVGDEDGSADGAALSDVDFIRACVAQVCQRKVEHVEPATSFYDLGLDSQGAIKLRSRLVKRFGAFPLMFIFEHPSLEKLHGYLTETRLDSKAVDAEKERLSWIVKKTDEYKSVIDGWATTRTRPRDREGTGGEVIYLTGASGALGNALLEVFVQTPAVQKVYCAIRGQDPLLKLQESLRKRGYAKEIYANSKICAVPYDMKDEKLGLAPTEYDQLLNEVTVVIHNAWKMDFNQRVEMFEADCLNGTMNLLSFCYAGTLKFFSFMSSVAACMGQAANSQLIPEAPVSNDPMMALNTGYAQSKFIVEKMTYHYATALCVPVKLFRVGQLCGHSSLGVWNSTEMWPIMISTGLKHLRALPSLPSTTVNWLPVDVCASSIASSLFATAAATATTTDPSTYTVHNLVNPSPISWSAFLSTLAAATSSPSSSSNPSTLAFGTVSMREWVTMLERAAEQERDEVPGLKLLGFFQDTAAGVDLAAKSSEEKGGKNGEGVEFVAASVRGARAVDEEMVRLWLDRWRDERFV
ncbi:male sterility protein [Diplodia corticola]|uniref:Male sterility protein n=1 Tax=Diplodia corticola TaxID=236234 RepID=A0A1J9RGF0_9PEZI|nr:male sterility protein [Diplodia corticola]OJD40614.1 male sterility protein [Diplodia corticola]